MIGRPLKIDAAAEAQRISKFIARSVQSAGAEGVVVGISGGVDSAVVGELCVRALGSSKVVAALLPSVHTPKADVRDAERLVARWKCRSINVGITPLVESFVSSIHEKGNRIAKANVQARVRMVMLYYIANSDSLLVVGTGDRSELELGYYTKFGDGGVDFLPIAHLYKTQVRALASHLGLPRRIVEKPASPQLWPGHTASQELPAGYDELDLVLYHLVDEGLSAAEAARKAGVGERVAKEVFGMRRRAAHKRKMPPSLLQ